MTKVAEWEAGFDSLPALHILTAAEGPRKEDFAPLGVSDNVWDALEGHNSTVNTVSGEWSNAQCTSQKRIQQRFPQIRLLMVLMEDN